MEQQKIGVFLKVLRKEKSLTQSQFAEKMGVSDRTVSRWETGANMPDFALLIEIADFYEVDVREILEGERKINAEEKKRENMRLVAEYTDKEKRKLMTAAHCLLAIGFLAMIAYLVVENVEGLAFLCHFLLGLSTGSLLCGILYTSRIMPKLMEIKKRVIRRLRKKKKGEGLCRKS